MLTVTADMELTLLRHSRARTARFGPAFADEVAALDAQIARVEAGGYEPRTLTTYISCKTIERALSIARSAGF